MENAAISGALLRQMFLAASKAIADRAEEVNRLNVFPVPDGGYRREYGAHDERLREGARRF